MQPYEWQIWLTRDADLCYGHRHWFTHGGDGAAKGTLCAIVVPAPLQPRLPVQIGVGRLLKDVVTYLSIQTVQR